MASHTPTSELSDAAQRSGRRRASIAPRAQRRGGTPQCRRLHHARGSSGAPARGQAARERRASGVAAEPRARAACAPAARACAQATRRGGGVLRPFERCSASVVVVGGSSKKFRRQASQNLGKYDHSVHKVESLMTSAEFRGHLGTLIADACSCNWDHNLAAGIKLYTLPPGPTEHGGKLAQT